MPIKIKLGMVLYRIGFFILLPFLLLRLFWKSRRTPIYRHNWRERLAIYSKPGAEQNTNDKRHYFWVHAVSLGEMRGARPLIEKLRLQFPQLKLLISAGTAEGYQEAQTIVFEDDQLIWFPVDLPFAMHRLLQRFSLRFAVLIESELWPHLISICHSKRIPLFWVNARVSPKTQKRMMRLRKLTEYFLQLFTGICAQSNQNALMLGEFVAREIAVLGHLKFDIAIDQQKVAAGRAWRQLQSKHHVVALLSSRPEEELLLWKALQQSQSSVLQKDTLWLIVPRHPERFAEVSKYAQKLGYRVLQRSTLNFLGDIEADICIGDSLGEIPLYAGFADIALMGGSWEVYGGQNIIEVCASHCPVIVGPHIFNSQTVCEWAIKAKAAIQVNSIQAALEKLHDLLQNSSQCEEMAEAATKFASEHHGASKRISMWIMDELENRPVLSAIN